MLMEEVDLWSIVDGKAVPIDPPQFAQFENKFAKAKRIILDFMKDHSIPHVVGKSAEEIYAMLITLYHSVKFQHFPKDALEEQAHQCRHE